MTTLKAVRGTRDLLPPETALWNRIEATARAVFARYNFGEIRTPVFEDTALFARGVGEETDIVSKEMYTWEDRARAQSEKTQSLTLRPENTAGVVRAYIEHKLGETGQLQKLYYIGPQFRRERPQKGRYRQFSQIGAEVIGPPSAGSESPLRDAEVLEMLATLLDELGITGWTLDINSVGSSADRARYNETLRAALVPVAAQDVRGLPAPRRHQSAARARLQGPRRPAHHRDAAEDRRLPRRRLEGPLRRGSRRARCMPACPTRAIIAWCAASTTTPAPPSSSPTAASARRTPCSAAAATTASARPSAAPRLPASALPWAKTGWS